LQLIISILSRSFLAAFWLVVLSLGLTACSSNPATGGKDISFMSKDDEKRIGDENHPKILQAFGGEYNDPALQGYVKSLGQLLAASSELPDRKWTFTLLDSDVTNAFALPGGYVYVTRGLLSLAETEGQLAAVIGHEIGHVTARHGAQRHAQGTLAGIGAAGASILGSILVGPEAGRAIGEFANIGAQGYVASYSRDQEYQADELGIRYNGRIGFNPQGMSQFLAKLDSEKGLIAKLRGQAPKGSSYLDTHPPTPDRVKRARKLAEKNLVDKPIDGRDIYLSKIDGMIWGDSPDQGYARDGTFAHKNLNIFFSVPDEFTLFNSPKNVTAYGPDNAVINFDMGPKNYGGSMRDYIRQTWARNALLSNLQSIEVNGLEAATASTKGRVNGRSTDIQLVAIRGKEGHTFQLTFYSQPQKTKTLSEGYRRTTYSFRHMSLDELEKLKPLRIRLYKVRKGDTIESVSQMMAVKKFAEDRFKLLNGVKQNSDLIVGQTVKIISTK
jgi:predicted Zn-dependent protease